MATMPTTLEPKRTRSRNHRPTKLSRMHKPAEMSLEAWQRELRRQFGRSQSFSLRNRGQDPVFSEFEISNPKSQSTYRVVIRGPEPGDNHCTCGDFATNTLGTCKHIEFTLGWLEKKRGGKAALQAGMQPAYSEVLVHYGARREVRFRPGSSCPVELARLAASYFGPEGALLPEAFGRFETFLARAGKLEHELRCQEDVLNLVAEVRDAERRAQRVREAFPRGIRSAAFKKLLKVQLYPYQAEGALFAARAGRTLIGDEMGLGKTIQAIAAAEIMARLFGVERVLIVCPTSLKHQWQREIERFTERSAQVIGGLRPRRKQQFAANTFFKILNYDTVHRDLDLIQQMAPDFVILDEAQRIKNWDTRVARSVKKIVSPHALVLTGTPLENRLEELVSIVQFVDRFRLGPTFRLLHAHQVRDEFGRVVGYRELDKLGATLEPILLRRKKDQVLTQLPQRLDKNFFVPMTPEQRRHHDENRDIVAQIVQKWRRFGFLSESDQRRLMIALQFMRMSCDSSYLVDKRTDDGFKADELVKLLEDVLETAENKVVIFSQWLAMHELIARRLEARRWEHILFHGGVPGEQRRGLVDRFRDEPECRLFLSTDAGGVGLNLQHASIVVNMDLPWNPAVLEQRIGRVHRLGQKRPVQVVNFVAQGTIEEGMLGVLKFKKSLFAGVLDGGEKEVFLGGSRLAKFIETVEKTTAAIPEGMADEPDDELEDGAVARASGRGSRNGAGGKSSSRTADDDESDADERPAALPPPADPWSGLVQTGLSLLQQLQAPARSGGAARTTAPSVGDLSRLVARDDRTGENYLRLPMPTADVLQKAAQLFTTLLQSLQR